MTPAISVQTRLAMEAYRDSQTEIDPGANHSDLTPALSRCLGWLNQGENCEQKGMRVIAMLVVIRPDFIEEKSFSQMSRASKQIFDALVTDFRSTFTWRADSKT